MGAPFEVEILGQVLLFPEFGSRVGQPASIESAAVKGKPEAAPVPVIYIAGTCMNAGKTHAACALVRRLSQEGFKVGGAKLTGVSLLRDVLSMRDYGADDVLDFTDAGVACTGPDTSARIARVILSELAARGVDVIIAETGDGIMGEYGVQTILTDRGAAGVGQSAHSLRERSGRRGGCGGTFSHRLRTGSGCRDRTRDG